MKPQIKIAKKFGSGSHIIMEHEDLNKKFLIFPESSQFILKDMLRNYQGVIESFTNPLIKDFLTKEEIKEIKKCYEKKIKNIDNSWHKKFLIDGLKELETSRMTGVGDILNHLENELPEQLRVKLMREYYKLNREKY